MEFDFGELINLSFSFNECEKLNIPRPILFFIHGIFREGKSSFLKEIFEKNDVYLEKIIYSSKIEEDESFLLNTLNRCRKKSPSCCFVLFIFFI
jgi:hypothetical protein